MKPEQALDIIAGFAMERALALRDTPTTQQAVAAAIDTAVVVLKTLIAKDVHVDHPAG